MNNSEDYILAKEGNPKAIEKLVNKSLNPKGVNVKTVLSYDCLTLTVESESVPNQKAVVDFLKKGLIKLAPNNITRVVIKGKVANHASNSWEDSFSFPNKNIETDKNVSNLSQNKSSQKAYKKSTKIGNSSKKNSKNSSTKNKKKDFSELKINEIPSFVIEIIKKDPKKSLILFFGVLILFGLPRILSSNRTTANRAIDSDTTLDQSINSDESINLDESEVSSESVELWNDTKYGISESEFLSKFSEFNIVKIPDQLRMCAYFYGDTCFEYRIENFLVETQPVVRQVYFDVYFLFSNIGLEEIILVKEPTRLRNKNSLSSTDNATPEETGQHILDRMAVSLMLSGIYGEPKEEEVDRLIEKLTIWEFPEQNKSVTFSDQESFAKMSIRYETYEGRQRRNSMRQRPNINSHQL